MSVFEYLRDKPLFYRLIDKERMPRTYKANKEHFKHNKIIHVVGTNGKGSTGRFLALMLQKAGKKVGHYTSPHLLKFNERIWIDGQNIEDEKLESLHVELQKILSNANELSYFEYTTFLAIKALEECEYIVLEAGLGGVSDATNVFDKELSIFTPIGFDHTDFLGSSLNEIATSKLNSMQTRALINPNQQEMVLALAKEIADKKEAELFVAPTHNQKAHEYIVKNSYPPFLEQNLIVAFEAMKILGLHVDSLPRLDLRARHEKFAKNILLDCGHNEMAAQVLFDSLEDKKYIFVYNSFADKDVEAILDILAPKIKKVMIIGINEPNREDATKRIEEILKMKNIEFDEFKPEFSRSEEYVVFGSFHVVQNFLESLDA